MHTEIYTFALLNYSKMHFVENSHVCGQSGFHKPKISSEKNGKNISYNKTVLNKCPTADFTKLKLGLCTKLFLLCNYAYCCQLSFCYQGEN